MTTLEDNIKKLDVYLQAFHDKGIPNRIAGRDVAGLGGVFQSISPVDKTEICDVARGTAEDIDMAAKAAADAFRHGATCQQMNGARF